MQLSFLGYRNVYDLQNEMANREPSWMNKIFIYCEISNEDIRRSLKDFLRGGRKRENYLKIKRNYIAISLLISNKECWRILEQYLYISEKKLFLI